MTRTKDSNEPGALIRGMFRDLDPWFEQYSAFPVLMRNTWNDIPWMPPLEMTERDHNLFIKVDLPGMNKDNVNVSVTDDGLVIEGERTQETESKKDEWFTTERTYGHFRRVVPLPAGVNYKEVKATFRNGVLEVTVPIPAAETETPYKVPVEGEPDAKNVKVAA
jgi:HSP20 family protein